MNPELPWQEIAFRLACTVLAGGILGFNRGEHGHAAGFRTTLLVCLAASGAMLQTNLLLGMTGRQPNSFVMLDLMRLPLGILSGIGFIGAGAILRQGQAIKGVTTAATLWFVTVLGLCFGGGQIGLGFALLFLGWLVLTVLEWVDRRWIHVERAIVHIILQGEEALLDSLRTELARRGVKVQVESVAYFVEGELPRRRVKWKATRQGGGLSESLIGPLSDLAATAGVASVRWERAS